MFFSDPLQLVIIDLFGLSRDAVVSDLVTESGEIQWMAVRQMSAVREVHTEDLIAVLNRSKVNRHVRLRAAVRLYVGMVGAKQLFRTIDRSLLDNVSPFTPTVVTFARITLGILIRDRKSTRLNSSHIPLSRM